MNKSHINIPDCKLFSGYKPCEPYKKCFDECKDQQKFGKKILIISLEALGAVLQSTSILEPIKRKYPESTIFWITMNNAIKLLDNNPIIFKSFRWEYESIQILHQMEFDILYNLDKTQKAASFANSINAKEKFGFGLNPNGAIIPLNENANYSYLLGLDDELKFMKNKRTGQDILCETLDLKYERDNYILALDEEEKNFCEEYRKQIGIEKNEIVIGFNTGCSNLFPNKKMTIEQHIYLIEKLSEIKGIKLVLVGGIEDLERNTIIKNRVGNKVISTPTNEGLRKGICYENICDLIITGDSLGMHIAIGLKKYVIVWFGLSCWTEIDLYDRGVKFVPDKLECAPCWKKKCPLNLECIGMIDLDRIIDEVKNFVNKKCLPENNT